MPLLGFWWYRHAATGPHEFAKLGNEVTRRFVMLILGRMRMVIKPLTWPDLLWKIVMLRGPDRPWAPFYDGPVGLDSWSQIHSLPYSSYNENGWVQELVLTVRICHSEKALEKNLCVVQSGWLSLVFSSRNWFSVLNGCRWFGQQQESKEFFQRAQMDLLGNSLNGHGKTGSFQGQYILCPMLYDDDFNLDGS